VAKQRGVHEAKTSWMMSIAFVHIAGEVGAAMLSRMPTTVIARPIPRIVFIALVRGDVGLVEVVSPDGVEGGDVAGHARHERRQQRGEGRPSMPGGQ